MFGDKSSMLYICSSLATPIALWVITTAKYVLRGHHWDKAKVFFKTGETFSNRARKR
jgi:hypothetical protein